MRDGAARDASRTREEQFRARILHHPRVLAPGRDVFDTPVSHAFTIGSDEFIAGAPDSVAEEIIAQRRECGAGHFLAIFDRAAPRKQLAASWELFGTAVSFRRCGRPRSIDSGPGGGSVRHAEHAEDRCRGE